MHPYLEIPKFIALAKSIPSFARPMHDGIYRAVDVYLKKHPGVLKSERKRLCRLLNCKKLSMDACMHTAQNERLPLRTVVQVLLFEQVRNTVNNGVESLNDLPSIVKALMLTQPETLNSHEGTSGGVEDKWEEVQQHFEALQRDLVSMKMKLSEVGKDHGGNVWQEERQTKTRFDEAKKLFNVFVARMSEISEKHRLASKFCQGFQQELERLRQPSLQESSKLVSSLLETHPIATTKKYQEAGCHHVHSEIKKLSLNESWPEDPNMERWKTSDYAIIMSAMLEMYEEGLRMQELIISDLSLDADSECLQTYNQMWLLRPFVDDSMIHAMQKWALQ